MRRSSWARLRVGSRAQPPRRRTAWGGKLGLEILRRPLTGFVARIGQVLRVADVRYLRRCRPVGSVRDPRLTPPETLTNKIDKHDSFSAAKRPSAFLRRAGRKECSAGTEG